MDDSSPNTAILIRYKSSYAERIRIVTSDLEIRPASALHDRIASLTVPRALLHSCHCHCHPHHPGGKRTTVSEVKAVLKTLKASIDSILPKINDLTSKGAATDATVTPLVNDLTSALNSATSSLGTLKPVDMPEESDEIVTLMSDITDDIATTFNNAQNIIISKAFAGIGVALSGVFTALGVVTPFLAIAGLPLGIIAGLLPTVLGLINTLLPVALGLADSLLGGLGGKKNAEFSPKPLSLVVLHMTMFESLSNWKTDASRVIRQLMHMAKVDGGRDKLPMKNSARSAKAMSPHANVPLFSVRHKIEAGLDTISPSAFNQGCL
ncbi:hypothetical protein BD779DRAFT_1799304 [Infundibulicybe gibba]|nr:hypothetical protein BD779DRAFT_1799304 [Infundibulicybe gibba]